MYFPPSMLVSGDLGNVASPARLSGHKRRRAMTVTPEKLSASANASAKKLDQTPERVAKVSKKELNQSAEPKAISMADGEASEDLAVLPVLFSGLEFVLQLLGARGVKAFHSTVYTDVASFTGKGLNNVRLARILGIAGPGMIDVNWVGAGPTAKLELLQKSEDGKERPPTIVEQQQRKDKFLAALEAAVKTGTIPQRELPPRPLPTCTAVSSSNPDTPAISVLPEPFQDKPPTEGVSAIKRRQALLDRIRAKEASGKGEAVKEYDQLRHRITACDNALTVHSVLQSLFARGDGKFSAASDAEVMKAICSTSFGMQCRKTLDKGDAQEAIQLLASKASDWFSVEAGVHVPDAKYFRRLPQGSASVALAAVKTEREDLERQLHDLCEKRRQQNLLSEAGISLAEEDSADLAGTRETLLVESASSTEPVAHGETFAQSVSDAIHTGCQVEIKGLKSRPDLNGCRALVVSHDKAAGRFVVRFHGPNGEEHARCRPENLELVVERLSKSDSVAQSLPLSKRLRKKTCVA